MHRETRQPAREMHVSPTIEEIACQLVELRGRDGARGDEHAVDPFVVEDPVETVDRPGHGMTSSVVSLDCPTYPTAR